MYLSYPVLSYLQHRHHPHLAQGAVLLYTGVGADLPLHGFPRLARLPAGLDRRRGVGANRKGAFDATTPPFPALPRLCRRVTGQALATFVCCTAPT